MIVGVVLIAAGLVVAGVYALVSYFIVVGMMRVAKHRFEDRPSDYGAEFEEVAFRTRRGYGYEVELSGWRLHGREGAPTIIFSHGFSAGRTGDGLTDLACRLNRRGFGALMFDFRAHGLSGGTGNSGGWHERMDILGAYDYLVSHGAERGKVGLLGVSMGAASAALAAAEEPGIGALALDCPYAEVSEMMAQEVGLRTPISEGLAGVFIPGASLLGRALYGIEIGRMSPERAVAGLGYPVMVACGSEDTRIPAHHSRRVCEAAVEGSEYWEYEGAGHAKSFLDNKGVYEDRVAGYFWGRFGG